MNDGVKEVGIGIEVKNLRKRLRQNQALDGISLTFTAGMMHGVIGPEGAGKTTLLRLLADLLHPDAGEIVFHAGEQALSFESVRAGLAYMPQQQSLYPDLSVGEHLDFFRDLYQLPAATYAPRRDELLEITRLKDFVDRPAGQLSGGMYKKLGLMCALLRSPRVLLLDEPTNGVDPISRREFWDLLYRLVGQGILVILTTAYMDEAERCADAHVLHRGRVLASGDPQQLLAEAGVDTFEALFLAMAQEPAVD
jgi:ABC-2 type transport system ATP-binding protein